MDKINDIRNYVDTAGLNPTTTKAFQEALSDDYISNIMKIAEDSGADIGNRKLMALRR
ncbi:MAG: hypothetical protein PHR06_13675 [Candidatus Cloacimonetes bacterium]|nr:hypothetical protein [Candidatus Cloacimonadota bacterium]